MSVTLKQIAEKAGVSQPLVTYALNGKPGVSESTRRRILRIASQMGYSPHDNRAAKSLAARRHGTSVRTGVLALLLPPPSSPVNTVQDNPFFLPYFNGVEIEASRRDYDLFVCALRKDGLPRLIRSGEVDGVIGIHVPDAYEELKTLSLPTLSLGSEEIHTRALVPDEADGIRQAVQHLVKLGHKRIAYIGMNAFNDFAPARKRLQAFRESLAEHNLSVDDDLIDATSPIMERRAGAELLERLMKKRKKFTALVCYNDLLAMGAVDYLQHAGKSTPGDLAVVGFDGYAAEVGFQPKLTSVAFDRQAMGRYAVAMLCEQIEADESTPPAPAELFPTQLTQGETT